MDVSTIRELIALVAAGIGLIGTLVGAFFAVKNWIKVLKEKNAKEIWALIMEIADTVMKDIEKSELHGVAKKEAAISAIKKGCKAAGIDLDPYIDQVSAYIDSCIEWHNGMNEAK